MSLKYLYYEASTYQLLTIGHYCHRHGHMTKTNKEAEQKNTRGTWKAMHWNEDSRPQTETGKLKLLFFYVTWSININSVDWEYQIISE